MTHYPDNVILDVEEFLPSLRELIVKMEEGLEASELEYASDNYLDAVFCQLLSKDDALTQLIDYTGGVVEQERRYGNDGRPIAELCGKMGLKMFEDLQAHALYSGNRLPYFYSGRIHDSCIIIARDCASTEL